MCIHTTHTIFQFCTHIYPIPAMAPFYISPSRCARLTAELEWYHTQPDRIPEETPYPAPKPCPIKPHNSSMLLVPSFCGSCTQRNIDVAMQHIQAEYGEQRMVGEEEVRERLQGDREWPYGDRVRVSPLPENFEMLPSMSTVPTSVGTQNWLMRTLTTVPTELENAGRGGVAESHVMGREVVRARPRGVNIVESPEVVGAFWKEGDKIVLEEWRGRDSGPSG